MKTKRKIQAVSWGDPGEFNLRKVSDLSSLGQDFNRNQKLIKNKKKKRHNLEVWLICREFCFSDTPYANEDIQMGLAINENM